MEGLPRVVLPRLHVQFYIVPVPHLNIWTLRHGSWVKADWARKHQRTRRNSAFAQSGGLWGGYLGG